MTQDAMNMAREGEGPAPHVHLNPRVQNLAPSATLAINERSDALARQGRRVFKLGLGQSPFPVPEPVVEALRAHADEKAYLPVKGLWELREAVARHHSAHEGINRTGDDVLIGPGSKELLFLLQLAYGGDLIIPTPSWVSYAPQADILGRSVHWLPTDPEGGWKLTPDVLDRHCAAHPDQPQILILNYPNNPTGGSYNPVELEALAAVAREHRIVLLSDEIYGGLHHSGAHASIARFYPDGTIISGGLSKWCGAGGWRLGTFTFPPALRWLHDAMAAVASETFTSTSAPIQYAAIAAFEGGPWMESYLERSRRVLRSIAGWVVHRLERSNLSVAPPDGAFYVFVDFSSHAPALEKRGITNSRALCEHLLQDAGVAILPGDDFGRPAAELTARLATVNFDGKAALAHPSVAEDGTLDEDVLRAIAPDVLEAIDRICRWVEGDVESLR